MVADVTDETALRACSSRDAEAALGGLDGVVVNVGIGYGRGLEGTDASAWDLTFAINLRAHFLIARAALPRLQPGGAIVFVSSIAGIKPGTGIPAYDASKAGLAGLCRHVAFEGARRGIRANLVVPGLIDTPLGRVASRGRRRARRLPCRSVGRARPGKLRTRRCSCSAGNRAMSRGSSSLSMAGCRR